MFFFVPVECDLFHMIFRINNYFCPCDIVTLLEKKNVRGTGGRGRRREHLLDDREDGGNAKILEAEGGNTRRYCLENSLWYKPWPWRKREYVVVIVVMVMTMMCINGPIYLLEAQCDCLSVLQSCSWGFHITSPFRGNILSSSSKFDMSQVVLLGFVKVLDENTRNVRIPLPTDSAPYPKTTGTWEAVCFPWGKGKVIPSKARCVPEGE